MRVSDIPNMPLDTLLAIFFNCSMIDGLHFAVTSIYRETKFLKMPDNSHIDTARQLSSKYHIPFEVKGNTVLSILYNDISIPFANFLDNVYSLILVRISRARLQYDIDREIALAMFALRGSADFNRGYYAVDIKNGSNDYFDNMFKILLSSDKLLSHLNLNFRELQPDYTKGMKRNTQVRINLKWFYDNVMSQYSYINAYKYDILHNNLLLLGESTTYKSFEARLVFYKENVLGRKLSTFEIDRLRSDLDFSASEVSEKHSRFETRNQKIVSYAREIFPDECVGCKDEYGIEDRTFRMPRNNRWYLEINHVIPYANDSEKVDVLDNLVKLCPTCHRALTPRRAEESLQKHIIEKMLTSRNEVIRFVKSMMPSPALSPVNFVYSSLK